MHIYRHYKSKLYRYLGVVKHSETLEDLVSYQCLYDNPAASYWVRPKAMFFDEVLIGDQKIRRFTKLELAIESFTHCDASQLQSTLDLAANIVPAFDREQAISAWNGHSQYLLQWARLDGKLVGFILGYPLSQDQYFVWMLGVVKEYRRLGIATNLSQSLASWCQQHRYKALVTTTSGDDQALLILQLKQGYAVTGTENKGSGLRLICEKSLASHNQQKPT